MSKFSSAFTPLFIALTALWISGCTTAPMKTAQTEEEGKALPPYKGGGYYKDDGPGANPPANLAAIPDAVPKDEPTHSGSSKPYKALGKSYTPMSADKAKDYKAKGLASWYGRKYHGKDTAMGEAYDMYAMTAAHATLPLPSYAKVTNLENGKSVLVRVNDRGPFHDGRIIDLSYTAAYKLDILKGVTEVEVETVQVANDVAPATLASKVQEPVAAPQPAPAPVASTNPLPDNRVTAEALPAPNLPQVKPQASGQVWYLQLGAFSSSAKADDLMQRVSEKLSKDFPGVMRIDAGALTKVQAGPFMTDAEAERASARLQQELGLKAYRVAANAPVAKVEAAPVAAAAGSGIYLQFAAVSNPGAAEVIAAKVKTRFGNELPAISQVQTGNLIKVQAGPFASPAEAEAVSVAYQQDFGSRPYRIAR
ncbi:MAG: septal ring lytic transglycosylase RlpA family protein [Betaproteobacteria bacterium]|nr:septal ring lytic transglycosylase RlpA family protein [Betaproteobacteria bacterium]